MEVHLHSQRMQPLLAKGNNPGGWCSKKTRMPNNFELSQWISPVHWASKKCHFPGLLPTTRMSASDEYNTTRGCAVIGLRHSLINIQSRSSCSREGKRKTIPSTPCFPLCRADTIRIYHTPAPRTNPLTAC